jgi:hypothetical protein
MAWPKDQNGPGGLASWHGMVRLVRGHRTRGSRGGTAPGGSPLATARRGLRHDDDGTEGGGAGQR